MIQLFFFGLLLVGVVFDNYVRQLFTSNKINLLITTHIFLLIISATVYVFGPSITNPINSNTSYLYNELADGRNNFPFQQILQHEFACASPSKICDDSSKRVVYDGFAAKVAHDGDATRNGFHLNVLPLHGYEEVSFLAKGISLDVIHPSQSKPYGMISTFKFSKFSYNPNNFDWVKDSLVY